jgi:hypothetical protein
MHQQQLLHLAASFGWIPREPEQDESRSDEEDEQDFNHANRLPLKHKVATSDHDFLTPRRLKQLTDQELRHLRKHYITRYSFPPNSPTTRERLQNIETMASVWDRCLDRGSRTTYRSQFAQRKKLSGRLNSFACFEQEVDINARFRQREEVMVTAEYYGDILYFLLHEFENVQHALVYVHMIRHTVVDGRIQENGQGVLEFTGVESLKRLVGRVTVGHGLAKTYVIEEVCDSMIERLRNALL